MAAALTSDSLVLLALWADTIQVHALLLDEATLTALPVSTPVEAGRYPALSPSIPHAAWFERMIHDLWGRIAEGGRDQRPWLDHATWPLSSPLAVRPDPPHPPYDPPDPPLSGHDPLMQLPLGPIWGRIEEAAQLRLTLSGKAVVAAESRLGFSHKGTLTLVRGKPPRTAARFAARLSGDCTVAHAVAFAAATEAALEVAAPPRAVALRIVMLEIERIAGHLDNLTEVARLAACQPVRTRCGYLRERLLQTSASAFGHRLMMDCVVPGGLAMDIAEGGPQVILRVLGDISSQLAAVRHLHHGTALSARLTGVGRAGHMRVTALGAGGVVGRASGRRFDARAMTGGYHSLAPRGVVRQDGDAAARQHLRISEIDESLRLISAALDQLPPGPLTVALPQASGEGIGCAESVRGDIWHWLRLDHGQIAGFFPRDPGWALWPLAEQVLQHGLADDADLIRASFALPVSGMDL
ncbi:nickel-dependent hydrogenase large subunit [Rhodopila sp.]|uniref:NADH-quinone oxidoreductase subunit D-related protein n=1 Tax=Rhodopila sp. TaxID=2480087 RepID=UPI003D0CEE15